MVNSIREQNIQVAAGVIGQSPMPNNVPLQLSVNTQGRLQTPEEFGDIVLKASADGAVTHLRDVGRVELAASEYGLRALLDNKQAVAMAIKPAAGREFAADFRGSPQDDGRAAEGHAARRRVPDRLRPDAGSCVRASAR